MEENGQNNEVSARRRLLEERRRQQARRRRMVVLFLISLFLLMALSAVVIAWRYMPTSERMPLTDYYAQTADDELSVIINGTYDEPQEGEPPRAVLSGGFAYLSLSDLKQEIDGRYFYDTYEHILRYVTEKDVITARLGESGFTVDDTPQTANGAVVLETYDTTYVLLDFAVLYSDFTYTTAENPGRLMLETAGFQKKTATVVRDTPLRRFGGVKSRILGDAKKGDTVMLLEDYGKWLFVQTADGVRGCLPRRRITSIQSEETASRLPKRVYSHNLESGSIVLGWDQMSMGGGNARISQTLAAAPEVNVISPTWMALSDDYGGVDSYASEAYIETCHENGVKVWGLVSNLETPGIDTAVLLNTTTSRDKLVGNLIREALAVGMDGINVDFENMATGTSDGYIEFLRELSLQCEANALTLSTDEPVPTAYSMFRNRADQADFVDYVIIMAYDEHFGDGSESGAGSVASLPFVTDGVEATLEEVPAEQVLLGVPFYSKVWTTSGSGSSAKAISMQTQSSLATEHAVTPEWLDEEGQYYYEFTEDGATSQVWMEEKQSLDRKLQVMKNHSLAGCAAWSLSWDVPDEVWEVIAKYK